MYRGFGKVMGLESLLDELWGYAETNTQELESNIKSVLKGHSSDGLIQAISFLIAQEQHENAKTLLADFLRNNKSAAELQRRLELILHFKKHRAPQSLSIKKKLRGKDVLLKEINDLVASSKFQAAESLLLEAIEYAEEPDYLDILGRVYMLQRRPVEAAKILQRALLLKRKLQAFVDTSIEKSQSDDTPTEDDLAFINFSSVQLTSLENEPSQISGAESKGNDASLTFIQKTAKEFPPLNNASWWDDQPEFVPSDALTNTSDSKMQGSNSPVVADDHQWIEHTYPSPEKDIEESKPISKKPILSLSRPKKPVEPSDEPSKVKIFNKPSRHTASPLENPEAELPEKIEILEPEITHLQAKHPNLGNTSTQLDSDDIADQDDEDEDGNDDDVLQRSVLRQLITPRQLDIELDFDDLEDDFDDVHDLHAVSIIDPDGDSEEDVIETSDSFGDFEDDYAAYAFDPDEAFDSDSPSVDESDDGLSDRLSREDRALQKAAELVEKTNWPLNTLPLIQQIFVMSGWGQTRLALEREIEKGLTPEELILASHIKVIWAENDAYWIAFDKNGSGRLSHHVLSWPTALLVVRSFDSLPQIEEIEVFLETLFETWYDSSYLCRAFRAFARYLWFRFSNLVGCLPANQPFSFCNPRDLPAEDYSDLGMYDNLEIEQTEILNSYGIFQSKHPQEPSCYFSDMPVVVEVENRNGPKKKKSAETSSMTEEPTICLESEITEDDDQDDPGLTEQWSAMRQSLEFYENPNLAEVKD